MTLHNDFQSDLLNGRIAAGHASLLEAELEWEAAAAKTATPNVDQDPDPLITGGDRCASQPCGPGSDPPPDPEPKDEASVSVRGALLRGWNLPPAHL